MWEYYFVLTIGIMTFIAIMIPLLLILHGFLTKPKDLYRIVEVNGVLHVEEFRVISGWNYHGSVTGAGGSEKIKFETIEGAEEYIRYQKQKKVPPTINIIKTL